MLSRILGTRLKTRINRTNSQNSLKIGSNTRRDRKKPISPKLTLMKKALNQRAKSKSQWLIQDLAVKRGSMSSFAISKQRQQPLSNRILEKLPYITHRLPQLSMKTGKYPTNRTLSVFQSQGKSWVKSDKHAKIASTWRLRSVRTPMSYRNPNSSSYHHLTNNLAELIKHTTKWNNLHKINTHN